MPACAPNNLRVFVIFLSLSRKYWDHRSTLAYVRFQSLSELNMPHHSAEDEVNRFFKNVILFYTRLHGVIYQKTAVAIAYTGSQTVPSASFQFNIHESL